MKRRQRRQRVALRVKLQRGRGGKSLLLVFVFGAVAAGVFFLSPLRFRPREDPRLLLSRYLSYRAVEVSGVPPEVQARMLKSAGRPPAFGGEEAFVARWAQAFPAYRVAGTTRNPFLRRLTVRWAPRLPIARLPDGRGVDREGRTFEAPGVGSLPLADPGTSRVSSQAWAGLEGIFAALDRGGLPRAVRAAPSRGGGWFLTLEDGTEIEWGEAARSREKAERLAEVLRDARRRFQTVVADLRYFDDGKVLVRSGAAPRATPGAAMQ